MNKFQMVDIERLCADHGFVLEVHLGDGAFKDAYLVSQEDKKFAFKIMHANAEFESRVLREVGALEQCDHFAIAKIKQFIEAGISGKRVWILVEEYLGGGTLTDYQGDMGYGLIMSLARALSSALEYLHSRRIVHRDIKPANILFRSMLDSPVLTDFGIVRMLDEPSLTRDFLAQGPGTPLFASPEQLNNDKYLVDWRTDQYGLALTLAFCILGHHPFQIEGEGAYEAITKVALRKPLPLVNSEALVSKGFSFLLKSLDPWPINRYRRPIDLIGAIG